LRRGRHANAHRSALSLDLISDTNILIFLAILCAKGEIGQICWGCFYMAVVAGMWFLSMTDGRTDMRTSRSVAVLATAGTLPVRDVSCLWHIWAPPFNKQYERELSCVRSLPPRHCFVSCHHRGRKVRSPGGGLAANPAARGESSPGCVGTLSKPSALWRCVC
jgi:hypothetical protein